MIRKRAMQDSNGRQADFDAGSLEASQGNAATTDADTTPDEGDARAGCHSVTVREVREVITAEIEGALDEWRETNDKVQLAFVLETIARTLRVGRDS